MKLEFRFGEYHLALQDAKPRIIDFPEDSVFITAGDHDIGEGLHNGALNILVATRASDEVLESLRQDTIHFDIVRVQTKAFNLLPLLRINGYAFITLHDCIQPEEVKFVTPKEFNKLLGLDIHHEYFVYTNEDYEIIKIVRVNAINGENNINVSIVDHTFNLQRGRRICDITPDWWFRMKSLTTVYRDHHVIQLQEEYGKKLFDDLLYTNLSIIYPEFKDKIIGYDLDYTYKLGHELFSKKGPLNGSEWFGSFDNYAKLFNEWEEFALFKKELPIIEKN